MKRRTASFQTLARVLDRSDLLPKGRSRPRPREVRRVAQPLRSVQQLLLAPRSASAAAPESEEDRQASEGDDPCRTDHPASAARRVDVPTTTAPAVADRSVVTTRPGDGAGTHTSAATRSAPRACARGARPSRSMSITSRRCAQAARDSIRPICSRCVARVTIARRQASARVAARAARSPRATLHRQGVGGYARARRVRHRGGGEGHICHGGACVPACRRAHFLTGLTPPENAPAPIST
jgi:hypothetical protein